MLKSWLIVFLLLARANAQQPTNLEGFAGVVRNVAIESNGAAATVSIEAGSARITHQVHCTATTQITKGGKTVPLLQVKKGQKIECSGTPNGEVLEAATCTIR